MHLSRRLFAFFDIHSLTVNQSRCLYVKRKMNDPISNFRLSSRVHNACVILKADHNHLPGTAQWKQSRDTFCVDGKPSFCGR